MKGSWKLGKVAGIRVFVHWTFLLLLAWVLAEYLFAGLGWSAALEGVVLVLAVFVCVVLHEFGHALTARRFGISTQDITVLPIGGVARLARIPEDPWQELPIALAGPAVNVVIAAAIFGLLLLLGGIGREYAIRFEGGHFLTNLMLINVLLVAFNLLPAFPMDGGRVLRALLAVWLPHPRATRIAARIGQGMAVLFALAGLFGNLWLMIIGLFVFLAAQEEGEMARIRSALGGIPVSDAMLTRVPVLSPAETLDEALPAVSSGYLRDLPVLDDDRVVGLLRRPDVFKAIRDGQRQSPVARWMHADFPRVQEAGTLEQAFEQMQSTGYATIPVLQGERLLGVVTGEMIAEWMRIRDSSGNGDGAPRAAFTATRRKSERTPSLGKEVGRAEADIDGR